MDEINAEMLMLDKLGKLVAEKGYDLKPEDLLIPEIEWLINCTTLSSKDKEFARLRYIEGLKYTEVMDRLDWYSSKTFTKHNKYVWSRML